MSKTITILVAKSGSGKSTYANRIVISNPWTFIINRDSIRRAIVGNLDNYYERDNINGLEIIVNNIEDALFENYAERNYSIIIDNTNLKQKFVKRWIDLARYYHYNVRFKIFDLPAEICKERVMERDFAGRTTPQLVEYIDIQDKQFHSIVEWINKNYKDKILE